MSSSDKCCCIIILIIGLTITLSFGFYNYFKAVTHKAAFAAGYEQVRKDGYSTPIWVQKKAEQ